MQTPDPREAVPNRIRAETAEPARAAAIVVIVGDCG